MSTDTGYPELLNLIEASGLEACNRTELYQLCQKVGIKSLPRHSREELILLMLDALPVNADEKHNIDSWRNGLAGFVLDHWKVLQNQITCPLKSQDPLSCFGCLDAQVITCLASNENNLVQIRKHRK